MRISDWSSDVCSSDLRTCTPDTPRATPPVPPGGAGSREATSRAPASANNPPEEDPENARAPAESPSAVGSRRWARAIDPGCTRRSEEHTSELQSLMRISYAVFCLHKKNEQQPQREPHTLLLYAD